MKNKIVSQNTKSDKKKYNEYFRRPKSSSPKSIVFATLKEYGIFVIPFFPAYLLFYCIIFDDTLSGDTSNKWLYAVLLVCILTADIGGFFLRKFLRNQRFIKYSRASVPVYKGNRWTCPHCREENNLISPCKTCGIFPELYKSDKQRLEKTKKSRSRKEQREYDAYVPQFDEN